MGHKMTWEQMKTAYPNEWVAVVNFTENKIGDVDGEVALHSNDRDEFHRLLKGILSRYGGCATRYTGELIKNAEIPLLWQISRTA